MEIVRSVKLWMRRDGLASNGCGWVRTNGNFWNHDQVQLIEMPLIPRVGIGYQDPPRGCMLCALSPRGKTKKWAPHPKKQTNAIYTNKESENVNSLPRGQPPKRAQNTRLKTTRFQKSQYGTHLTSKFGETIRRIFRARNPIHILKLPFLERLLNTQKMTN